MKKILDMHIPPRPPRVLYIGSGTTSPGIIYLNALRDGGFQIFHIGEGSRDFDLTSFPKQPFVIQTPFGQSSIALRRFKLRSLLDLIGYDFDLIFHVQDWTYFTDEEKSIIPYFFYCTEIMYPVVPRCAHIALAATDAIKRSIQHDDPSLPGVIYHPHSVMITKGECKYPTSNRKNRVAFAGEIYRLGQIYKEREETVKFIKSKIEDGDFHWLAPPTKQNEQRQAESGKGLLNGAQYAKMLLETKIGLNIPTVGGCNFREVEICAAGAMLLTKRTPDTDLMGLVDGYNCRLFDTKEEALEIITNGYDPEIAKHGWELVIKGHKWWRSDYYNYCIKEITTNKNQKPEITIEFGEITLDKIKSTITILKNKGLIGQYEIKEHEIFLQLTEAQHIESVLQSLGFKEWSQEGHTIYHRIKELATIFQRYTGVSIPKKVSDNIPKYNETSTPVQAPPQLPPQVPPQ